MTDSPAHRQALEALRDQWREKAQLLCRRADHGSTAIYADRLAAQAEGIDSCADAIDALLAASPAETPPDDWQNVAMTARMALAFGHQATPQTPERMIERKEQSLRSILAVCERHGATSSILRAEGAMVAGAAFDRDRDATCAWNCTLAYPHEGPCSPVVPPPAVPVETSPALETLVQKMQDRHKEYAQCMSGGETLTLGVLANAWDESLKAVLAYPVGDRPTPGEMPPMA